LLEVIKKVALATFSWSFVWSKFWNWIL